MINTKQPRMWAKAFSLGLMLLASFVLLGWIFNIETLKSIIPGLATMKPNTALSFILTGFTLWLINEPRNSTVTRIAQITALVVFLIGLLTLSEYLFHWNLGIDQFLFQAPPGSSLRMSEATAFAFMLLGLSLLLIKSGRYILVQLSALLVVGLGLLAFSGYVFSVSSLYSVFPFNSVAIHTSLALCLAGTTVLLVTPQKGFFAVITQNYLGGVMARRLLPAVIIVPLVIGWLRLQGQYLGYYNTEFGLAVFAVSNIIIFTLLVWWTARLLNRIDYEHQQTAAALKRYSQRMEILHNIDLGIISSQDMLQLVEVTITQMRSIIPCEHISVSLVDQSAQELTVYASAGERIDDLSVTRIPIRPRLWEGFDADNARVFDDLRLLPDPSPVTKTLIDQNLVAFLQVRFLQDGQSLGTINLSATVPGFFTTEYRQIAIEIANQLAVAVKQMRLTESLHTANRNLERYVRRMEILHNIDLGIISSQDVRQLMEVTLKEMRSIIPCQRIAFSLVDEASPALEIFTVDTNHDNPFSSERLTLLPNFFDGFNSDGTRSFEDLRLVQGHFQFADVLLERGFLSLLQVKINQDSHPIGIVHLAATTVGFFTLEYRQIAIEIANQLAVAVKQMRLTESLKTANHNLERYGRRMEILHSIDLGIIASQATVEIATTTFKLLRTFVPCQRISLKLVDEATQELVVYAADSDGDPLRINRIPLLPQMLKGFDDRNIRVINDLRLEKEYVPLADEYLEQGFLTLLQVLLVQDGAIQGLVTLAANTLGFFTSEYREVAIEVTDQLSIAIKQMHLTESLQAANEILERYARRMEILHNIDRGIIASHAITEIIETALREINLLIPCELINITLLDEVHQEFVVYASTSNNSPLRTSRIPAQPYLLEGFDENNSLLVEDIRLLLDKVPELKQVVELGFQTALRVRLIYDGVVQGFISLLSMKQGFFTPDHREIAIEVAHQVSIAIKQTRLSEALKMANDTLEQRVIERTAELNAAKEQVEAILNNSLDGILLTNADMSIQKTNPAFEKLFAPTKAASNPASLLDIVDSEDAVRVSTSVQTALTGLNNAPIEVRARREDGTTFDVELSIGHIEGDGLVSTVHDITSHKMLERQLRYQASIQNTVADAVIATDLEFNVQSWNKAAERIYGWQADEVIGKPVRDVLQTEYSTRQLSDEVRRVFIENGHWSGEVVQYHRDGRAIYILSSTVLFKDSNGNPFGVLAVNHDISERKQAEDALRQALEREKEVNEMKTRFISIASHEFRSPLAAISMLTESLSAYRDKMEPEQIDQRLERIQQQVTHVTGIMDDVLESARMQGDYLNFKPVQANLDKLYREIVEEFAGRPEFSARINYSSDEANRLSRFDPRLMRQIFTNLLSNALKYSQEDKPVTIKLLHTDRHIILDVTDNGIGIPAEDLKFIFEPFHRAGNVGSISGTGLGMSITKKAVEMHDGTIEVKSTVGQGTIFTVVIPMPIT